MDEVTGKVRSGMHNKHSDWESKRNVNRRNPKIQTIQFAILLIFQWYSYVLKYQQMTKGKSMVQESTIYIGLYDYFFFFGSWVHYETKYDD